MVHYKMGIVWTNVDVKMRLEFLEELEEIGRLSRKMLYGIWRKFWIKIKENFRGMDYFCGINNLNEMDQNKVNIKEKMESK